MEIRKLFKKINPFNNKKINTKSENIPTIKNLIEEKSEKKLETGADIVDGPHTASEVLDKPLTHENIINIIIKGEEKKGRKFENSGEAVKFAERKFEKIGEKMRNMGIPVCCIQCGKAGSNKETGAFRKTKDGYIHENCRIRIMQ